MDEYMTIKETADIWDLTTRRVQKMCADGRIDGAKKFGNAWAIPRSAQRPSDARVTTGAYRNWRKKNNEN